MIRAVLREKGNMEVVARRRVKPGAKFVDVPVPGPGAYTLHFICVRDRIEPVTKRVPVTPELVRRALRGERTPLPRAMVASIERCLVFTGFAEPGDAPDEAIEECIHAHGGGEVEVVKLVRRRGVWHAAKVVRAREKRPGYWVVTARVPAKCRDADRIYVHVLRGAPPG